MEAIAILAGLAFAVNKTVTVIKAAINKDWNTTVTQVVVWLVGTAAIFLASRASITAELLVPGLAEPLGTLDGSSIVLLGFILGSTGSFAFDIRKAIDNTDSAQEAKLLGSATP